MRRNAQLGMIGFGAMGREVMTALTRLGETDTMKAVLVRPGREAPSAVHDVQAQSAPEADGDYPIRLDPPARDEGPHLSYAVQWFLFSGVVIVGYPLLLRRRARTLDTSAHVR